MTAIRGKNTMPEMLVRRLVHSLGYRFRLHDRNLPGSPDLVLSSRRKVIFIHGCFWHRHICRKGRSLPATRQRFWMTKFSRNRVRDLSTRQALVRRGWRALTIWECQLDRLDRLTLRIMRFLGD